MDKGAFEYEVLDVTENTVTKLMKGDFKYFEDMDHFNEIDQNRNDFKATLLYKLIGGGDDADMYIVETIFYESL